jgi:ABC-2 type transport system ATP-binding protein
MEEAQALCDRIGIIDRGKLLALGTLEELRNLMGESDMLRLSGRFDAAAASAALAKLEHCEIIQAEADSLMVALRDATRRLPTIFAALAATGAEVHETTLNQPTLESLFIKLTGRELRE